MPGRAPIVSLRAGRGTSSCGPPACPGGTPIVSLIVDMSGHLHVGDCIPERMHAGTEGGVYQPLPCRKEP